LPPVHCTHPITTPSLKEEQILAHPGDHPTRGCVYVSDQHKLQGIRVSALTTQKPLIERGLGCRYERLRGFEERAAATARSITAD
jgi:hypothetical protein